MPAIATELKTEGRPSAMLRRDQQSDMDTKRQVGLNLVLRWLEEVEF
jgi:hypothetical protein